MAIAIIMRVVTPSLPLLWKTTLAVAFISNFDTKATNTAAATTPKRIIANSPSAAEIIVRNITLFACRRVKT